MKLGVKLFIAMIAIGAASIVPLMVHWSNAPQGDQASHLGACHTVIAIAAGAPITSKRVRERLCGADAACQNGKNRIDVGVLESDVIPQHPVSAVVETDENCAPDVYGLSHCTNALQLPDGSTLVLRYDHNMQVYPCLKPGEIVTLVGQASA